MLKPLNNRVVIEPEKEEIKGGIVIPDSVYVEKPSIGTVVASNNELINEGDRVIFSKFGFDEVKHNKKTYYLVSADCILAIIQ